MQILWGETWTRVKSLSWEESCGVAACRGAGRGVGMLWDRNRVAPSCLQLPEGYWGVESY